LTLASLQELDKVGCCSSFVKWYRAERRRKLCEGKRNSKCGRN
jgi:hypothetical protein